MPPGSATAWTWAFKCKWTQAAPIPACAPKPTFSTLTAARRARAFASHKSPVLKPTRCCCASSLQASSTSLWSRCTSRQVAARRSRAAMCCLPTTPPTARPRYPLHAMRLRRCCRSPRCPLALRPLPRHRLPVLHQQKSARPSLRPNRPPPRTRLLPRPQRLQHRATHPHPPAAGDHG